MAIPHFEKMLYDNGPLLHLYADAWALTGDALFKETAVDLVAWLLREMRAPEGGFYSALDADSEGHEGKFYVWTPDEVRALLSDEEYAVAAPLYGLTARQILKNASWNPILAQPWTASPPNCGSTQTWPWQGCTAHAPSCSPRAKPGCAPDATTSSSPAGTR